MAGFFALGGQQQPQEPRMMASQAPQQPQNPFSLRPQINQMASGLFDLGQKAMAQPYNYDNAPKVTTDNFGAERIRVEKGMYDHLSRGLNDRYAQEEAAFRQKMANEGVDIGSKKYQNALREFQRNKDSAYGDAQFQALMAGGQEHDRIYGMQKDARSQYIAEQDSLRDRPFKEMASILNPALQFAGLESQEDIARMQDSTQRYGIDTERDTTVRGQDINKTIAEREAELQRYGIDKSFETAGLDRTSRETVAGLDRQLQQQLASERSTLERELQAGRITSEEHQARQQDILQRELQAERIAQERAAQEAEQQFQSGEKKLDRRFTGRENKRDRRVQMAQIRAAASRAAGGGGGGSGAMDPAAMAELMQLLAQMDG